MTRPTAAYSTQPFVRFAALLCRSRCWALAGMVAPRHSTPSREVWRRLHEALVLCGMGVAGGPGSLACLLVFWPFFVRGCWHSGGCFVGPVLMGLRGIGARWCVNAWTCGCSGVLRAGGVLCGMGVARGLVAWQGFQVLWPPPLGMLLALRHGRRYGPDSLARLLVS